MVAGGASSAVGGADGIGTNVYVRGASDVAADSVGGVYYTDQGAYTLRYISYSGDEDH